MRAARTLAVMRAHQTECELARQQLVIGQPRAGRTFGREGVQFARPVQRVQRGTERRETVLVLKGRVLPFRQLRHLCKRRIHGLHDHVRGDALGQRIDRLDHRQGGETVLVDHAIRMHHLQHAVIERGGAGDVSGFADRKELLQILPAGAEIGDDQVAGLVAGIDQMRSAVAAGRGGAMAVDGDLHGHHRTGLDFAQLRPCAPIDRAAGQMEQEVDDSRFVIAAEQAPVEFLELRADARKRGDGRKEWIEQGRPHGRAVSQPG